MAHTSGVGAVTARDLGRRTAKMLDQVERTRRPILIFRSGRPVAALVALDEDDVEGFRLANSPPVVGAPDPVAEETRRGRQRSLAEVFVELAASFEQRRAWDTVDSDPVVGDSPGSSAQAAAGSAPASPSAPGGEAEAMFGDATRT